MIRRALSAAPGILMTAAALLALSTEAPMAQVNTRAAKLKGNWVAVLHGNTGCGDTAMLVTFTLGSTGSGAGTATITGHSLGHSTGCGDTVTTGQDFVIQSLDVKGSGVAGLTCGAGCGWGLSIQVNKQNNAMILTDVAPANPNNTPTGTALKQ
jgi:hypothetical protein